MNNSQEVMNTIKIIAKEQGKPLGKMLKDCGLSKNALSSMSSGYLPRTENLSKIADYLGVSVDYLLGKNEKILTVDSEDSKLEPIAIKASKSDWKRILSRLSEENLNRLQEYAELLLLKQAQDGQEE